MREYNLRRSLKDYFLYLGPALIVSMAYMDPGNYGTDIQAAAYYNYDLIWSVWLASLMAMVLQYLSGKLGIATGRSLPELVRGSLRTKPRVVAYWLLAEVAAAATDLAEYLGTVIALNLLFGIPLLYAAVLGAFDVLLLLAFASRRFRLIEYLFMLLVSIISTGFLYELFVTGASFSDIAYHSVVPRLSSGSAFAVVGIVGATVMPHALFVHSWLTRNRLKSDELEEKRRLLKLHRNENVTTLTLAGLVNVAILVASAGALFHFYGGSGNFGQVGVGDMYGIMAPLYGYAAAVILAITLLASGLASSTTGTLAGQAIMDGLLGTKVNVYLRRLVTRFINVFPTVIAISIGLKPVQLLVYSQVALSLMIPLPMVPLIYYTGKASLMGEFVNRRVTTLLAVLSAGVIVLLNAYLLLTL